jgi:Type VI secretion system/phage-baseplate injector OB domain
MNGTSNGIKQYYGKYAGTVTAVNPSEPWRLQLSVPDVLAYLPSTWAEPCLSLAGAPGSPAIAYFVPPVGAGVWVEFENGEPNRPIWVGGRICSSADVPKMAMLAAPITPPVILQSMTQNKIILSSMPGDCITLETIKGPLGPSIKITEAGIFISDGKKATISLSIGSCRGNY